jgi:hypothetical protein
MHIKPIYILLILGILIASYFLIRALIIIIKGLIRIIKNYRKLGRKEFFNRLRDGTERITPTQKTRAELIGIIISTVGLLVGVIVMPIYRIKGVWVWVEITLIGGLIIELVQLLSKIQLYKLNKKQDEIMKSLGVKN